MKAPAGDSYEVIVMGGGPAGTTCATLLAQQGRRVLLLEKEFFPRHHVGESLIPETYWPLKRIGALEKIKAAGFTKKFSVQFASASGKSSRPFYFFETNHHESAVTWQVSRSKFDKILLDHARESGVEAVEGAKVTDVIMDGDRVTGVEFTTRETPDATPGEPRRVSAPVTVDATGLNALISSKLGLRRRDPCLKKAVIYGYFRNAMREPGVDEGATLVLKTQDGNGWFWFLPLEDDVTSVGVVADPDYLFKGRGRDYEAILMEEIDRCLALKPRMKRAERVGEVHTASDFSYRSSRCAGPGYVLIGDAFGFLDPVYSSGAFLALKSGEFAADAIDDAFRHDDFSGERLGAFGERLTAGLETFRKLVYAFYTEGFSFGQFMQKHPDSRHNLIDILVGDVFKPDIDAIFEPMREVIGVPGRLSESGGHGAEPTDAPTGAGSHAS